MDTVDRTLSQSIVRQLHDILVARIRSGELSPGDKILSERELCEAYQVSRTTARNALLALEHEGYVRRVIGSGTYVRNPRPALPASSATGTIGFVLCRHHYPVRTLREDYFYFEVMEGIQARLKAGGGHLLTYHSESEKENETILADLAGKVDGVLLGEVSSESLLREAVQLKLPCVLVNPSVDHARFEFDSYTIDNVLGAYKAIRYLTGLGHTAIGFIRGPVDSRSAASRLEGYRRALQEAGIPARTELIEVAENWTIEQGMSAVRALLERAADISAVFCSSDTLAVGAVRGLAGSRSVPENVSVVGFDDIAIAAYNAPALTTVRSPILELGRQACTQLLGRIQGSRAPVASVLLAPELVVRESTSPPEARRRASDG